MAYKIVWSNEAEKSFNEILDYISYKWSEHEAMNVISRTSEIIKQVSKHPYLFKAYKATHSIRHGILHKNTTMFYQVLEETKTIRIMLFWNNARNPRSLKL